LEVAFRRAYVSLYMHVIKRLAINVIMYDMLAVLFAKYMSAGMLLVLDNFVGLIPEPEYDDSESKELKSLYHTGYRWRKNKIFYDDY